MFIVYVCTYIYTIYIYIYIYIYIIVYVVCRGEIASSARVRVRVTSVSLFTECSISKALICLNKCVMYDVFTKIVNVCGVNV